MRWKQKAFIQNVIAALPEAASYELYYRLQRRFGGLRRSDPRPQLRAGVEMVRRIRAAGGDAEGRHFVEVGTGRRVATPTALWLAGAGRVTTVDVNPYLKAEMVREDLAFIRDNVEALRALFDEDEAVPLDEARLARVAALAESGLDAILAAMDIDYISRGDARALPLAAESVDYHVSYNVFEHIPPDVLAAILREAGRLLAPKGMAVHRVDYTDHFAHSDPAITTVNFLQFTADQWDRLAGNRYMYMNRLRVDDFERLFHDNGLPPRSMDSSVDERALAALEQGLPLAEPFDAKPARVNATADSWIVAGTAA